MNSYITAFCAVISICISFAALYNVFKKDKKHATAHSTTIDMQLNYISKGIDDIRLDQKDFSRQLNDINIRLIKVEVKTADKEEAK